MIAARLLFVLFILAACSAEAAAPVSREVVYSVTGSAPRAGLTERTADGSEQRDARLPYERAFTARPGAFLFISAQIQANQTLPTRGRLTARCTIFVDGVIVSEAEAEGRHHIATCSARAP